MKLVKIINNVFYISNPTNIGVIRDEDKSVILIDTGLDSNVARKILKILAERDFFVKAVINTHAHADHCGGNRFIKEKTGATIYAPEIEAPRIQYPSFEPFFLFSGVSPPKELQNKFLMASPSSVDYIIRKGQKKLNFTRIKLEVVPLPGHTPNQIGIEIDNILFCADSLFSEELLNKHKIPFFVDIDITKETLSFLRGTQYKFYVPSHAKPNESIVDLVDINLKCIKNLEDSLIAILRKRKTTEQILKELCDYCQVNLKWIHQYYLLHAAVMAFLSSLYKRNIIKIEIENNFLFWCKTN